MRTDCCLTYTICNEANFRGPETVTCTARAGGKFRSRNRRTGVVTVTALPSRVAVPSSRDFQVSRSPPPEPGGGRPEGSRRPGGTTVPDVLLLFLFAFAL
ncbi:hypothetical protein Zmor_020343 [Zophobas morio]|uniref:Uncharacterized protein n=1 Tax=Zophobas morio TaxID=2755281 RepID=A0AA38M9K5_9CUCU|nr:hypothetical protein Zmor_020343 [Zophobas morio]